MDGGGVALRIAAAETRSGSVPCGTGAWTRACRMAEGPGLLKTTRRRGGCIGGHLRGGGTRAAGGDGNASRPRKTHATSGAQG